MSPEVAVWDAETKSNDIKIRNDGTDRTRHPNALRYAGPVETGSNSESSDCV
jgi:hypothetical protein